ncbi:MAG TPA: Uma2 family endonuclease [Longimicrobiales bacterium]|nr:Uma2 family endonuclease [Longimicrobiales bacterium]
MRLAVVAVIVILGWLQVNARYSGPKAAISKAILVLGLCLFAGFSWLRAREGVRVNGDMLEVTWFGGEASSYRVHDVAFFDVQSHVSNPTFKPGGSRKYDTMLLSFRAAVARAARCRTRRILLWLRNANSVIVAPMAYRITDDRVLTVEQYEALPDDDRYFDEVSRGYLVREPKPGDAHGRLVTLVSYRLMQYVEQHPGHGRVYTEAGFVLVEQPLTVRGPDVAFVRAERVPSGYSPGMFRGAPDLAIEIVSPGNRPGELLHKISEFLEAGTAIVWVIDPAQETAVVHDQSGMPRVLRSGDRLDGGALLPGLSWDLDRLFADY